MQRIILGVLALLAVCLRASTAAVAAPPQVTYVIVDPAIGFDALPGLPSTRYTGVQDGAAYRIEVPKRWNGQLVLYAHGFRGNGNAPGGNFLYVSSPAIRAFLLQHGYAWAASSYSKNFDDVRQGVIDTHALNGVFQQRVGTAPSSTYVTGHSMGGHITGVLIERYPHDYIGALPMFGVMGDVALVDYFVDYNLVAQDLSSVKAVFPPPASYQTAVVAQIKAGLGGAAYPATLNERGEQVRAVIEQRSGGTRPNFIGDLFVPFSMEQIYARRARRIGRADLLVQRAYRDVRHCGFAPQEEARAFADLVAWVEHGIEPAGDDVLDAENVAGAHFGCQFTQFARPPYPACPR